MYKARLFEERKDFRKVKVKEIPGGGYLISTAIAEWAADEIKDNIFELRHKHNMSNHHRQVNDKYSGHIHDKKFEGIDSVIKYIEKHDYRKIIEKKEKKGIKKGVMNEFLSNVSIGEIAVNWQMH